MQGFFCNKNDFLSIIYMQVINPNDNVIKINYFNRYDKIPVTVDVYNESTRKTVSKAIVKDYKYSYYRYVTINNEGVFNADNNYFIKVLDNIGGVLFQDKVLCTDSTQRYNEVTKHNEYVIYD